jgi:hypothetical protein
VAVGGTTGSVPRNDHCRRCGTAIDFLSSCPNCGTVAGIDPTLADGALAGTPRLTLVAPALGQEDATPAAPVATDPWAPPRRSALPAELVRAWDVTATPRTTPAAAKRRRRIFLGALVLLVAAGVSTGVVASVSRGGPKTTPLMPVHTYRAPGAPFEAAFPALPIESHAAMSLDGAPYVATAYTAFAGQQMFSATVYPFPLGMPNMSAEQFLRLFTSKLAVAEQLTIPGSTPTTFRRLPALAALLTSPSGTTFTKLLAVLQGHVAYVLMVSGNTPNPSGYASFVTSFQLAPS